MHLLNKYTVKFLILMLLACFASDVRAQESLDLTLEKAVDIAMDSSYRVKQLQLGIERSRNYLYARQAGLKSRVSMNLQAPNINSTSEFKWNSTLQRDEIVRQDTRRVQMDLSIRQPVILFGHPTNGYLSLNNRMYQYEQGQNGTSNVDYYNRYFISFEQPILQPNYLKNNIEEAELDLERQELSFINDLVRMIDDIGDDYYQLFELAYERVIYTNLYNNLERVSTIVNRIASQDTTKAIEVIQAKVELANAQERLLGNQSEMRLNSARMIQRLRLEDGTTINIDPTITITPITVNLEKAIEYGYNLRPRMRELAISRRRNEINLQETKARDSFRMNLAMTYGLEKQDEEYDRLWEELDNSYSMSVNAYVPIWDWGQRKYNVEASKISMQQTDLSIEESRSSIKSEITNAVANLDEYQTRALNMKRNVEASIELTEITIDQYQDNLISLQDLLKTIERQRDTENNFLEAYLGYRNSLLQLLVDTYFDYEKDISLIDQFRSTQASGTESEVKVSQKFRETGNSIMIRPALGMFSNRSMSLSPF